MVDWQYIRRLRLSDGRILIVTTISWKGFLCDLEGSIDMACGGCGDSGREQAQWWQYVRAGTVLTSFASEQDAMDFLARGFENTPEKLQETYAALLFKYEQHQDRKKLVVWGHDRRQAARD